MKMQPAARTRFARTLAGLRSVFPEVHAPEKTNFILFRHLLMTELCEAAARRQLTKPFGLIFYLSGKDVSHDF